jgi:hypothetical protein
VINLAYLKERGHHIIDLKQVENYNCVNIIVNEQKVLQCKIDEFEFGGDGELDPMVIKAEHEIQNAY